LPFLAAAAAVVQAAFIADMKMLEVLAVGRDQGGSSHVAASCRCCRRPLHRLPHRRHDLRTATGRGGLRKVVSRQDGARESVQKVSRSGQSQVLEGNEREKVAVSVVMLTASGFF